jgi:hypothetical protein
MVVDGQRSALAALPQGTALLLILQEAVWSPGPVWMDMVKQEKTSRPH